MPRWLSRVQSSSLAPCVGGGKVDTRVLGTRAFGREGPIPSWRTTVKGQSLPASTLGDSGAARLSVPGAVFEICDWPLGRLVQLVRALP